MFTCKTIRRDFILDYLLEFYEYIYLLMYKTVEYLLNLDRTRLNFINTFSSTQILIIIRTIF